MAPEIKKKSVYKGSEVDVFSLGVVIFSMIQGLFPFVEAKSTDQHYAMLARGHYERYWGTVDKKNTLSEEFKDLIVEMFAEDGGRRPTLHQIRGHPWMADQ